MAGPTRLRAPEVPRFLIFGETFYKFDDDVSMSLSEKNLTGPSSSGGAVTLRMDPKGLILYWKNETTKETNCIDLVNAYDTRRGKYARTPADFEKMRDQVEASIRKQLSAQTGSLEDCLLTVATVAPSKRDQYVAFTLSTFVASSAKIAERWADALFALIHSPFVRNGSVAQLISRQYAKLRYCPKPDGKVHVVDISNALAANIEGILYAMDGFDEAIQSDGTMDAEKFTEEHFNKLYRSVVVRNDLLTLFTAVQSGSLTKLQPFSAIENRPSNPSLAKVASAPPTSTARKASIPQLLAGLHSASTRINKKLSIASPTAVIPLENFLTFLNTTQRDARLNEVIYPCYTPKTAKMVVERYESDRQLASKGQLSFDGFVSFLLDDEGSALSTESYELRAETMTLPLSHYFIASSHNTCLTMRQYGGREKENAKVEMYKYTLLTGCRCVELDCWEAAREEPVITHGPSVLMGVNELLFREVIEAIAESAFKVSDYPVILSFDNKASNPRVQAKMAACCKEILRDTLLDQPLQSHPLQPGRPLPSPQALLRKILIKNKKMHTENPAADCRKLSARSSSSAGANKLTITVAPPPQNNRRKRISSGASSGAGKPDPLKLDDGACGRCESDDDDSDSDSDSDDEVSLPLEMGTFVNDAEPVVTLQRAHEAPPGFEVSALVNYVEAVRPRGFDLHERRNRSYELCSFNENKAMRLIRQSPNDFVNFNKRQISRIYPHAKRVDSANFNPQVYWNAGCQLVSLNYQTLDAFMQLYLSVCELNGASGYLLKPECMRSQRFYPFEDEHVDNVVPCTLSIEIISGQCLSDRRTDTSVRLDVFGLAADTQVCQPFLRTRTVPMNGINPVYASGTSSVFAFKKIILPALAHLRVSVFDEVTKQLIGYRVLPIARLRPGYRHIVLRNAANKPQGLSSLFVHIDVRDYVPENYQNLLELLSDPLIYLEKYVYFAEALANPIAHLNRLEKHEQMLKNMLIEDESQQQERRLTDASGDSTPLENGSSLAVQKTGSHPHDTNLSLSPPSYSSVGHTPTHQQRL